MALCAALPVLWLALGMGPVHAQTNSPSGNQNTGQTPSQGGTSSGANAGGDEQSGNRTTPGGGGATGGGASGAGSETASGGGNTGVIIAVVALLVAVGVALAITTRHRRVMEDAR